MAPLIAHRRLPLLAALLALAAAAHAQTPPPAPQPEEHPFDLMQRLYGPLCKPGDDLSFPMKVLAASASPSKFATSTRELFYRWATTAAADWRADLAAYVPSHGDVHLGNTAAYVVDLKSAQLALGLIDLDETARMPFQIDLLQALITLRHIAADHNVQLTPDQLESLTAELTASYRAALDAGFSATQALHDDPDLAKLLKPSSKTLRDTLTPWVEAGRFKRHIVNNSGRLTNLFRPILREHSPQEGLTDKPALAAALARAVAASPSLAAVSAYATSAEFEAAIEDAVDRVRSGSGGSQGMYKILVLVRGGIKTLDGNTTDALLYLKQQDDRSAAQRAGFIPPTDLPGGRRVSGGTAVLTSPELDAHGWCNLTLGGIERSFFVTVRNPWEDSPSEKLDSLDRLLWGARYLGTLLGAAHRNAAGGPEGAALLSRRINAQLRAQLLDRSTNFIAENQRLFDLWTADPRVAEHKARAEAALAAELASRP